MSDKEERPTRFPPAFEDHFSGDGFMVFFNDPVPCPDPSRARRQDGGIDAPSGCGPDLSLAPARPRSGFGVGIAQGCAMLGQIGFSERSGYTAIGTVCNLAARLCPEAKDGQILIAQGVAARLDNITLEDIGPMALKGLMQPGVAFSMPLTAGQPALRVIEGGPANG
jgi:adenylate cyclase